MARQVPPRQSGGQSQFREEPQSQQDTQRQQHPPEHADLTLEEALTGDMRLALHDFVQSAHAAEWCANECIDLGPEMAECVRLCRDVSDIATLNVQFIARDSSLGPELAEVFAVAAEECAAECAGHSYTHCQECATTLERAVDSTWTMLETIERDRGGRSAEPRF